MDSELQHIADKVRSGRRIAAAEAFALWRGEEERRSSAIKSVPSVTTISSKLTRFRVRCIHSGDGDWNLPQRS